MGILADILGVVVIATLLVITVWGMVREFTRARHLDPTRMTAVSWCEVDDEDELTMADGSVYRLVAVDDERTWRSFPEANTVAPATARLLDKELERMKLADKWVNTGRPTRG